MPWKRILSWFKSFVLRKKDCEPGPIWDKSASASESDALHCGTSLTND